MFCGNCGFEIKDSTAAFCPECGAKLNAHAQEAKNFRNITPMEDCPYDIGRVWSEWTPVRQIGKGSFGVVYEAVRNDSRVESRAAIKVISIPSDKSELDSLRSEGLDIGRSKAYFKDIVDDFVGEIEVMESLKGLANIVSVEDYKVVEKTNDIGWEIYIRMELLTPLNTYLCDKKLSENEVIALGMDICTALEYCSKRNIIHRDIKPENIFINDLGCFKLGDFGIAKRLENMSDALTYQKGTLNYMAPEVALGKEYDSRVDLYSLGLVLYKLLNGNMLPFLDPSKQLLTASERKNAVDRRIKGEPIPAPSNASTEMADLVLCVCEHDPKLRYATAAEMKKGLQEILDGTYVPYTPKKQKKEKNNRAPVITEIPLENKIPLKNDIGNGFVNNANGGNINGGVINRKPDNYSPVLQTGGRNNKNAVNDQPPPKPVSPVESPVDYPKKSVNKTGLIIGIILGVLLLIGCIVGGIFLTLHILDNKDGEETTVAEETATEEATTEEETTEEIVTEEISLEPEPTQEVVTTIVYRDDPDSGGDPIIIIVTEAPTTPQNTTTTTTATTKVNEDTKPDNTTTTTTTKEPEIKMPSGKTEIVNFFKTGANSIKNSAAAGYTRKQWHTVEALNTGYALANNLLASALNKMMKSEDDAGEKVSSKGSSLAKERFPGWNLSDLSKVASATCTKSGENFRISLVMKDEDSPSRSGGSLPKVSNSIVYLDEIEAVLSDYLESYTDVHLWYRNYTITAVMTPEGEFISIDHSADIEIQIGEITALGITLNNISGYMRCNCKYYNFAY
ncbi:MAG: zinc-ribbon domain-containing protein [Ruminococcaceae bacterium]|nr:zinc-ribbon domain-containing protein [Oscillospiraceae bacterium]